MMLLPWVGSNEGFAYAERGEVFERSRHFVAQRCGVGERRRHHIVKCKDRITQRAGVGGFPLRNRPPILLLVFDGGRRTLARAPLQKNEPGRARRGGRRPCEAVGAARLVS